MVEAFYCWLFMMSCPRHSEGLKVFSLHLNLPSLWTPRTAEPNRTDHPVDKNYEPRQGGCSSEKQSSPENYIVPSNHKDVHSRLPGPVLRHCLADRILGGTAFAPYFCSRSQFFNSFRVKFMSVPQKQTVLHWTLAVLTKVPVLTKSFQLSLLGAPVRAVRAWLSP